MFVTTKRGVGLSLRNLGLVDDLARTAPAIGLIIEACKEPHRLFGLLRQGGCLLHQRCAERFELLVDRLSENERQAAIRRTGRAPPGC